MFLDHKPAQYVWLRFKPCLQGCIILRLRSEKNWSPRNCIGGRTFGRFGRTLSNAHGLRAVQRSNLKSKKLRSGLFGRKFLAKPLSMSDIGWPSSSPCWCFLAPTRFFFEVRWWVEACWPIGGFASPDSSQLNLSLGVSGTEKSRDSENSQVSFLARQPQLTKKWTKQKQLKNCTNI